ncbi:DUF4012 domain-containing protein [Adlercreutzia sp. ZJ304]|uniref:DUF4012 domain-containing protein n=1 Tax=Adlercreutzia sp. ZJ304 TaxID=2709791 RepID=UPI0013EE3EAC|nr:DUF4012 domain-containing protein [Adlercreutzia sp. ZJ304]
MSNNPRANRDNARRTATGRPYRDSSSTSRPKVNSRPASSRSTSSNGAANRTTNRTANRAAQSSSARYGRVDAASRQSPIRTNLRYANTRANTYNSSRIPEMPPKKRMGKGKKIAIVVVAVVLVLGLCCGGVAFAAAGQATELKQKASQAMTDINSVMDSVKAQEYTAAVNSAIDAKNTADDIQEQLSNPIWSAVSILPVVGEDIRNVRVAVSALQIATNDALIPLTSALQATPLSALIGADGAINIDAMNTLLDSVEAAAPSMQKCTDMIEGLPDFHLSQIQNSFGGAKEKIAPLNDKFQQLSSLAPIIGMLLGSEGDRSYMIAAQNSAELRAAGGFPGSIGFMSIKNGLISMEDFTNVYDALPESAMPANANITDVERRLFDDEKNHLKRTNDLGAIPDFERVASIWAQVYADRGDPVDGVISITPSVVQDVLAISGAITLSDGTMLDGTNATKVLEHDLYWKYLGTDEEAAKNAELIDLLFAEAAAKAMSNLFANLGSGGLTELAKVIFADMETREFMVWLTDEAEQAQLSVLNCSGSIGGSVQAPELGIYTSIMTPSKLGWYLDIDTELASPVTNADGTVTYSATTTVTNSLTEQECKKGSNYIIGRNTYYPWAEGDIHPWVYFVAPSGGSITDLQDDAGATIISDTYNDVQVIRAISKLNVGKSATYTYKVTIAPGAESELSVTGTPLLTEYRLAG